MKADPEAQRRLLELQALDTSLAQLAHRRRTLPEYAEVDRLARELSALEDERVRVEAGLSDIDRDIARLEKDIEQVRARADRDRARLDAGTGPARELEALQHELGTLTRRQGELEDEELQRLEEREQIEASLNEVQARLVAARTARAEVETRRDTTLADLDKDRDWKTSSRAPLVADLPADLVALYEKIRESTGMGAALLRAGRCEGCRLDVSGSERARVKAAAPDEVVRCEECRRILVRTNESGL
ncbi:MAG TPA: C4-type zinc ribbon domain-containing protein [Micromonosporaceae bacterium]